MCLASSSSPSLLRSACYPKTPSLLLILGFFLQILYPAPSFPLSSKQPLRISSALSSQVTRSSCLLQQTLPLPENVPHSPLCSHQKRAPKRQTAKNGHFKREKDGQMRTPNKLPKRALKLYKHIL